MNEILALKQELLEGNFDEAIKLTTELETMSRQDKINAIENFLALMVSRLIAIQVATDYLFLSHLNDIRNCLIEIQQRNRLGESAFMSEDDWADTYDRIVPHAILIAAETTELLDDEIGPQQLQETIDFDALKFEALKLLRFIYHHSVLDIDRTVKNNWSHRQIFLR